MRITAGMTGFALVILTMALAVPWPAVAQEDGWSGTVDLGYRFVSADGNEDKYREDVNLSEGLRLFNVELSSYRADSDLMDEFLFSASGLGGDPYTRAGLRLRKTGRYDLQIGYRSSDYFYRDAGYFFSDIGDLHTWNSRREFYNLSLRIQAADWVTVRLGAERMDRSGDSETSGDIQQEVFQFAQPVDQEAMSFWLGADFHWSWADLTIEQRLNSYENRWLQTVENSDGLEPGGSTLNSYRLMQVQDADTPVTRLQLAGNPHDNVRFTLGYAHMAADVDYDVDGDWDGLDFTTAAFQTALTNTGAVSRDADLMDLDVTWSPVPNLDLTADVSYRTYDQDGTIDFLETQTGGVEAGNFPVQGMLANRLDLLTYGLTANWRVSSAWTVLAGAGMQTRETDFDLTGPVVETERTIYRGGVGFRPSARVDLRLVLETGEDDDPLTQVSPTDIDRLTFRGRLRPRENLHVSFHYKDETRENLLSTSLGVPTDDVPPATEMTTAEFDVSSWGAFVGWTPVRLDLSLGYTRTEIDSNADIVYLTGFTFAPVFDLFTTLDQTGYTSDQDSVQALVRMDLGKGWSAGAMAALSRSEGTFPVDWSHLSADVRYQLPKGLS
ncbi:MAG: hypothetical protein O7F11_08740, partial [Acidobacteria bacterium]|nr:hypothetical protein [Acidobacteriota bacterium]